MRDGLVKKMGQLAALNIAFLSLQAMGSALEKKPLSINFNQMIESTSQKKKQVAQDLSKHYDRSEALTDHADSARVVDFVDVEIGMGEEPKIVDRRHN